MINNIKTNILLIVFSFLITLNSYSQDKKSFWQLSKEDFTKVDKKEKHRNIKNYKLLQLNYDDFVNEISKASKFDIKKDNTSKVIKLPNEKGELEEFKVFEKSVFYPELQRKYPQIKSYIGVSIENPLVTFRFSVSPQKKLNGLLFKNNKAFILESFSLENDTYIIYSKESNDEPYKEFKCLVDESEHQNKSSIQSKNNSADDGHRTYRLAMSATAEYTVFHGGFTGALEAINATLTNVNAVFETDLNVTLELVDNTSIIYTNTATDPYSSLGNFSTELQATLSAEVGESNYDIGHLVHKVNSGSDGNGGCIGCVCVDGEKGSGYTASTAPEGTYFDIDFVAHEMGHQFGAYHTWTTNSDGNLANEGVNSQMEPGSGSTIMSYAGITGTADIQSSVDSYFHAISIEQITTNIKSKSCQLPTINNNVPVVNAGSNFSIPKGTAFKLNGGATDLDSSDVLSYCWEQMDENDAATTFPSTTATTGVAFRSYPPVSVTERTIPKISDVLNGNLAPTWEVIPEVARNLKFRLTARDNKPGGGSNSYDDMIVFVTNDGPFEITSQNSSGIVWNNGATETITWNVNNSNNLSGSSNVNILLSIDGGVTFPITLAADTPNDGIQNIVVPNNPAPFCRIKIQPTNNIFFAINTTEFSIDYTTSTTCKTYTNTPNLAITDFSSDYDTDDLNVLDSFVLSDVNLSVEVEHTWLSDLLISILSPNGTQVDVFNRFCGSNEDLNVTFDDMGNSLFCATPTIGTFTPYNPLSAFNNESSMGTWTIGVNDNAENDIGTLISWTLELCETTVIALSVNNFSLVNFSVYPNPSKGEVTIKFYSEDKDDVIISMFDVRGRLIFNNTYLLENKIFDKKISFDNVSKGVYFLRIASGNKIASKKIIITQ